MSPVMSEIRVMTEALGGSPLSRLAQSGEGPDGWFVPRPAGADEWRRRVMEVSGTASGDWAERLGAAFGPSSGAAAERLARASGGQGAVVTTGQQPGLFGGPVYTWSKALSALALADALEAATGMPVAPVFWAATDDSDFAEGASTVLSRRGGAERVAIASTAPEGTRMADVALPDMAGPIERLAAACGSAADGRALAAARRAYAPGRTVGEAYVALLRELLEPLGIAVLDAAHPAVVTAAHPTLVRALLDREHVARALETRRRALLAAGYTPQVPEVADLTLVFQRVGEGGRRERVPRARAAVVAASADPGTLSPNVLLRPVVERGLLPTVAYVAGPGELAYFAQVSAVADALGIAAPLAVPRWSGTIVEPEVGAILARYGLSPDDFRDPHAVETRLARGAWPAGVASALDAFRRALAAGLGDVRASVQDAGGLVPAASIDGTGRAMEWRLGRLERRVTAAVKRRENALMHDLATARGSLFPDGTRQERILNLLPMLARHGLGLLDLMRAQAAAPARRLVTGAAEPAAAT